MIFKRNVSEEEAGEELNKREEKAKRMLENDEKLEKFLYRAEEKLKSIPSVGDSLAQIPQMISLINSYRKKEYTGINVYTIVLMLSAIIYFVTPIDLIPDQLIPFPIGYIDDAKVLNICLGRVQQEIDAYVEWRHSTKK